MTTTEKEIQHMIAEDLWNRDECFTVLYSKESADVKVFMRDETVFRIVVVKTGCK
jgi:hypothetical protein